MPGITAKQVDIGVKILELIFEDKYPIQQAQPSDIYNRATQVAGLLAYTNSQGQLSDAIFNSVMVKLKQPDRK